MLAAGSILLAHLFLTFGLGLCLAAFLPTLVSTAPKAQRCNLLACSAVLMIGVLVNHLLVLLFGDLAVAIGSGGLLALLGYALWWTRGRSQLRNLFSWGGRSWGVFGVVAAVYLAAVLTTPIRDWDARSIWFFQSKLIFYNGAFDSGIDWRNPMFGLLHVYYPKLIPASAAQIAYTLGYWNEYLPKFSLFILFLPAFMAVLAQAQRLIEVPFLLVFFLLGLNPWLSNGYMDGYVAIYLAVALLALCDWVRDRSSGNWLTGWLALGILLNLKNEGLALVGLTAGTLVVLATIGVSRRTQKAPVKRPSRHHLWLVPCAAFVPFVVWAVLRHLWNLENDISFDRLLMKRVYERSLDPWTYVLLEWFMLKNGHAPQFVALFGIAAGVCWSAFRARWRAILFPFGVAAAYSIVCTVVYLGTYHDLEWHISTSYNRLELSLIAALVVSIFQLVRADPPGDEALGEG